MEISNLASGVSCLFVSGAAYLADPFFWITGWINDGRELDKAGEKQINIT